MKRVWFDVSEIQDWRGHFTGIQRVIFNIGKELSNNPDIELKLCRYDRMSGIFTPTSYNFVEHEYTSEPPGEELSSIGLYGRIKSYARKNAPPLVRLAVKKAVGTRQTVKFTDAIKSIDLQKGDVLCMPGAFWTGYLDALSVLKRRFSDIRVVGIMYDLVPIVVPQFCADVTVGQFEREIGKALRVTDAWMAISDNTKTDLLKYAKSNRYPLHSDDVNVIRLGSDINADSQARRPQNVTLPSTFALFVSTIEARKNQYIIYQAVKRADELGIKILPIVLVGKHGWLSDDLVYLLRNDRKIQNKLIWLDRVDDKGLRWLYSQCSFTLYPSFYEGWGLPVAESLAYGKPCLASNSSSIPEVAGDLIDYFSPYSPDELIRHLERYTLAGPALDTAYTKAKKYNRTTWATTGRQTADFLLRV